MMKAHIYPIKTACILLILFISSNFSLGQTYYVFTTNSNSSVPITISINGYQYKLYEANSYAKPGSSAAVTVRLSGSNNKWEAYDRDGDRMTQYEKQVKYKDDIPPEGRNSSTIEYIRIILKGQTKLTKRNYNNYNDNNSASDVRDNNNSLSPTENSILSSVDDVSNVLANMMEKGMNIKMKGFPYFAVQAGYNRFNDFSFGIKYRSKGFTGMSIFANCGVVKKSYGLPWDVGFGCCFKDFALDLRFGNTDLSPNYGLMIDLTYDWYFYKKLGVSFITGLGFGDTKKENPDMIWNLGIGVCYKLWNK